MSMALTYAPSTAEIDPNDLALSKKAFEIARYWVSHRRVYYTAVLYALQRVWTTQIDTVAVDDGFRLYINPTYFQKLNYEEAGAALCHEVLHVIYGHMDRQRSRNFERWNIATDLEINSGLVKDGLTLPSHAVLPRTMVPVLEEYLLAETYYDLIENNNSQCKNGEQSSCAGMVDSQSELGKKLAKDAAAAGVKPLTPAEQDLCKWRMAKHIQEELQRDKTIGNMPSHLQRWAESFNKPQINWPSELRREIKRAMWETRGNMFASMRRPSRRHEMLPGELIFPGLINPKPILSVIIDTSGSMGTADLNAAKDEIAGIIRASGERIVVRSCDAEAYEPAKIRQAYGVELIGGGGTDMGAGINAAMLDRPRPDVIIVLTDGFTPWPQQPKVPTIVALVHSVGSKPPEVPDWARMICVPVTPKS